MLTALIILLLLVLGVVLALLFTPFRLVIDTTRDLYRVQWGPARAGVHVAEDRIRYSVELPFWNREGDVEELFRSGGRKPHRAHALSKQQTRSSRWRPPIKALLRTFRVRRFRWVLDTGDPLWNAWLYPLFHLFRQRGHDVSISFTGRNELELTISNNLYRLLKAVLLSQPTKYQKP